MVASAFVAVTILSSGATVEGGVQIRPDDPKTGAAWCDFYGVPVKAGIAVLFKAVEDDWRGNRKTEVLYKPGTKPAAPDWDGGKAECGGGLHFSPSPRHATQFCDGWKHLVACPVRVDEIAAHGFEASWPEKVKAPGVARAVYEVDIAGKRIKPSAKKQPTTQEA